MSKLKKYIYITIGFMAFILGSIGVIIPVLPTTPFLLLSSFCFARGSDRFDRWFKGTKIYKKHLESFLRERAMTLKQKLSILLFADIMIAFPLILIDSLLVKILLSIVIIGKFIYFFTRIKTIKVETKKISS